MNSACDYCSTSFSCSRLYAALKIIETHPELLTENKALAATFHRIKGLLAESGWNYPHGKGRCNLADQTGQVRQMTNELIMMLGKRKTKTPLSEESLLSQEYHRE